MWGCRIWPPLCWAVFFLYSYLLRVCCCLFVLVWFLLWFFNHERKLHFVKCFFYIYWNGHVIFIFHLLMWWVTFIDFHYFEPFLHPSDNSHFIKVYNLFNAFLNLVCLYFVENFSMYLHQEYSKLDLNKYFMWQNILYI